MAKREFGELAPTPSDFVRFESENPLLDMQCNLLWIYGQFSEWLLRNPVDLRSAQQEEVDDLLNKLVSLRSLHGLVTSRIATGQISGPAIDEVEFAIETQSKEFIQRCDFQKPILRPLPELDTPKFLSMRLHDMGSKAALGLKIALEFKDKSKAQEALTRTVKKFHSEARKAYTLVGKEPLPTQSFPVTIYDFQLELEGFCDVYKHGSQTKGLYEFELPERDFLKEYDVTEFLMDSSDIPGFLANIFQNLERAYGRRDVFHLVDTRYKDRSREPRTLRVKYEIADQEVRVVFEDQATGFRRDFLEHGFRVGETTTEGEEEHGLGMADYRDRFEKIGIKIILENYNWDPSDPNAIGARQIYIFPRPSK